MINLSEKMQAAVEKAYDNPELSMEDIISIMQLAREEFKIDKIILFGNKEYRYQMSHVLTCSSEGVQQHKPITCELTSREYRKYIQMYRINPVTDTPIPQLEQMMGGFFLNAGILRGGEYFGTIIFWSEEKRVWNESEKNVMLKLCHLYLLYLGMNNLVHGDNCYKQALEESRNDNVLAEFFVNMRTGKIQTVKIPDGMKHIFPEWGNYDVLLNVYTQKFVESFYKKQLIDKVGFAAIKQNLSRTSPNLSTEFPRIYNGELKWMRFMVRGNNFRENGMPDTAIATFTDITEDVRNNAYLFCVNNAPQKTYTTIVALNLNTEQYAVCVDERRKENAAISFEFCGDYHWIRNKIFQGTSAEERDGTLKNMLDSAFLIRHFDNNDDLFQCVFSFKSKEKSNWIRFAIIKAADYSPENRKVILYFSDITEMQNRQIFLEKENIKKKFQIEHDPLTGAYNRRGYERILKQHESDGHPMAFIHLDIDNFKKLNDTYGHAFGDAVLKEVAVQLKNAFRADDYVFRVGGDEFAVLLTNCSMDSWNNISYKQNLIHIRLNQVLKKEIYVTLSMGITGSDSGFNENMVALADSALYRMKCDGRAGCCVLDLNGKLVYEWKDDIGNNTDGSPLEQSYTGACRIELPAGELSQGRLICNETARFLMGFDASMSPEDCFKTWLERVDPYFRETITKTRKAMLEKGQAECTYIYHHPLDGRIMVRSGGRCLNNEDGIVFYGYHQSLKNTRIVLQENDSQKLIEAMTGLYFASYYVSLQDDWIWIFKSTAESRFLDKQNVPASVATQQFVQTLVKPEYREKMRRFIDLKSLSERLQDRNFVETEYESMVEDKGWCRVRILAVRRDEKGTVTHVQILFGSIDKEKKSRLEREKAILSALELQLKAGEMVAETSISAIGMIDRKTGDAEIYLNGVAAQDAITVSFDRMRQWGMEKVFPIDAVLFDKQFDLAYIEAAIQREGSCTMAFRQMENHNEIMTFIHHYKIYDNDSSKIMFVIENVTNTSPKGIGRIEEFSILEHLAEAVAVFDYETYEVVYVNKTVRDAMNMSISEFRNRKCYELFCDRSEPCEFCDKIILDQGQHGFMYRKIEAFDENCVMHGCAVEVNGRKYRLEQALNIDKLQKHAANFKL